MADEALERRYKLNKLLFSYKETSEEISRHKMFVDDLERKLGDIHTEITNLMEGK